MPAGLPPDFRLRRPARANPFRVERVLAVRYRPLATTWDGLLARLRELRFRAAICGPRGSGKTTLLEDLSNRLAAAGIESRLLSLRRETRGPAARQVRDYLSAAAESEVLLVDGAEQLGPLVWRTLRRRSHAHAGLVITSHAAGRLPTLVECRTDVMLLESIVAELVPEDVGRLRRHLPALYAAHHGNLRMCLRALYDGYAGDFDGFADRTEVLS